MTMTTTVDGINLDYELYVTEVYTEAAELARRLLVGGIKSTIDTRTARYIPTKTFYVVFVATGDYRLAGSICGKYLAELRSEAAAAAYYGH